MASAAGAFSPFPGVSEQIYCSRDFEIVRDLVYRSSGNVLSPSKSTLVYSRLAPLVRASGQGTFAAYLAHARDDAAERHKVVCALTTNHTAFFREDHHFQHFEAEVRPAMVDSLLRGGSARIWSAGSSSGEEVFTLSMVLLGTDRSEARKILSSDLAILASDLADHVLEKARAAQYDADAIAPVPRELRNLWIEPNADGGGTMVPEIRELVRFRALNLLGKWPISRPFNVIFCRNVMIYFDQPTKERLIDRFADQLVPGGHLYIGHSERVTGAAADRLRLVGKTIYRKVG